LTNDRSQPLTITAADGYPLRGFLWRHPTDDTNRPLVIINAATSVRCRYYSRFADYLHRQGFDVVTYDYRGIGLSRPASLRRLDAGWLEWGALDFEAVLQYAADRFPGQPIQVVGHSVGGFVMGLAGSWLLLVVLAIGVPLDSLASAALVATVLGQAVNASVFEVPIVLRTRETGDFEQALYDRLDSPGVVKTPGLVVGLLAFALLT